ncbi:hypothetical protein ACFV27_37015 [Streptomyces antimycoticus]|uniref:hypothetical protein n=1 Tax=Streptomyces antimycoticus TaxID=68175 RepID=UPI00369F89AC
MAPSIRHTSSTIRILAGIAAWAVGGILLGIAWTYTVGGIPPIWASIVLGVAVFAVVAAGRGRAGAFWRD